MILSDGLSNVLATKERKLTRLARTRQRGKVPLKDNLITLVYAMNSMIGVELDLVPDPGEIAMETRRGARRGETEEPQGSVGFRTAQPTPSRRSRSIIFIRPLWKYLLTRNCGCVAVFMAVHLKHREDHYMVYGSWSSRQGALNCHNELQATIL